MGSRGHYNELLVHSSELDYPSYDLYQTYREFGVLAEGLEGDIRTWTGDLSDSVNFSGDYEISQGALAELDELYLISRSKHVRERLQEFYDKGVYGRLDVDAGFLDLDYDQEVLPGTEPFEDLGSGNYNSKTNLLSTVACVSLNIATLVYFGYLLSRLD